MSRFAYLGLIALLAACGGAPATPTPAPTLSPTVGPSATPSPAPSPSTAPTPGAPAGFELYTGNGFQVALPEAWTVSNGTADFELEATSPLGGTVLDVFLNAGGLSGQTLRQHVEANDDTIESFWATQITRSETTVAGFPALRGEAYQTETLGGIAVEPVTHVSFDFEAPADSGDVWTILINTLGAEPDPAIDTIIESFVFVGG